MPTPQTVPTRRTFELSEDEVALVEFYRALGIDSAEALRRLTTPLSVPILPIGQELQANMPVPAEVLVIETNETSSPRGPG
jgi:hypothetical protein